MTLVRNGAIIPRQSLSKILRFFPVKFMGYLRLVGHAIIVRGDYIMLQPKHNLNPSKLTWKEFLDLCREAGIREDDEIDFIDISWGDSGYFECQWDDDFGWQISLRAK